MCRSQHAYQQVCKHCSLQVCCVGTSLMQCLTLAVHHCPSALSASCFVGAQVSTAGFWITQKGVILDTWRILWGPESRAVRLALWIAVIDQAMASTAIVNYAPALIQQTSLASNADATLWTGFVTGAKVRTGADA